MGDSAAIATVRDEVSRIGPSDRDVLIYGETIHSVGADLSAQSDKVYMVIYVSG